MADPVWLPEVLRKAGLKCNEFPGWRDRGHGDFGWIWGIVDHHTGSFGETPNGIANHPSLGLASQLYLGANGEYTICGVGIAWHAGPGSWAGIPTNNANSCTIGIEAANDGTSGWSSAQYNSYVKGNAAILNYLNLPSSRSIGHKEWGAIQGKWDPGGIDMNKFRREIAAAQAGMNVPKVNAINECAKANPWVGKRVNPTGATEENKVGADNKGRCVEFENAHIYWSQNTGAHVIPHEDPILGTEKSGLHQAFVDLGGLAKLGFPVRGFSMISTKSYTGAVQAFEKGILYRRDGHAGNLVGGVIGQRWALEGYEQGELGWPISNEMPNGTGGVKQLFENGALEWDPSGAVKKIGGAAYDLAIVNSAGFPLATEEVKLLLV